MVAAFTGAPGRAAGMLVPAFGLPGGAPPPVTASTLAVLADFSGTPFGGSPVWTDITADVMTSPQEPNSAEMSGSWGRQDWFSTVTASQMSFTLRNINGYYTPQRTGLTHNLLPPDVASPGCVTHAVSRFIPETGCTVTQDSTGQLGPVPQNPNTLKISVPAGVTTIQQAAEFPTVPATVGLGYSLAVQINNAAGVSNALCQIQWLNSGGGVISGTLGTSIGPATVGYSTITNATAPALTVSARINILLGGTTSAGTTTWFVGNACLVQSASVSEELVSPFYPNVTYGTRIRVQETISSTAHIFDGYVTDWTVVPQPGSYWTTEVNATDIFGRMGTTTPLLGFLTEEILTDSPAFLYPLQEDEGSVTFGDITGNQSPATIASTKTGPGIVTAGQSPPTGFVGGNVVGLNNPTYTTWTSGATAGSYLVVPEADFSGVTSFSYELWVQTLTTPPASGSALLTISFLNVNGGVNLELTSAGKLGFLSTNWGVLTSPSSICDGNVHHVVLTINGSTAVATLYLDGVSVGTTTGSTVPGPSPASIRYGMSLFVPPGAPFSGGYAFLAGYKSTLSAGRVADHYTAGSTAFAGQATDIRATQLLSYRANTGSSLDPGIGVMGQQDITGQTLADALLDVAAVEGGVVYADGLGQITLRSRSNNFNPAPGVTLDASLGHVDIPSTFRDDIQLVVNDVTVTRTGGADSRAMSDASIAQNGDISQTSTVPVDTDQHALDLAAWQVAQGTLDQLGVPTLTIDIYALIANGHTTTANAVLQLQPLDCVTLINLPGAAVPNSTMNVQIQGGTYTRSSEALSVLLYTTPLPPAVAVWDQTNWDDPNFIWAY